MRCLVLGGDGYLGWPTAMAFSRRGNEVMVVDNYLHRRLALKHKMPPLVALPELPERCQIWKSVSGYEISHAIGDIQDFEFLEGIVADFKPDTIIHYAQQRSAPFSMKGIEEARLTLMNNITTTFNLIWAVMRHAPKAHIIKLGTLGEYGTPNIDIEEGWIDIEHKGRKDRMLYPRQGGSLYHTTKIHDTDLLWFYVRTYGLTVTDIMQGPVYGVVTDETENHPDLLTAFDYDDIYGTVVNRFVVQAVAGIPLTVYGKGGQTRGFLNIRDTMQAIVLVAENRPKTGEMRILNQFTEQFNISEIADKVCKAALSLGIEAKVAHLENPRLELEEHYYKAAVNKLAELGLKPTMLTEKVLREMLEYVKEHQHKIDKTLIMPRVRWSHALQHA
ncbi:MAG: NAD-dependent dehydratase [Candidatus Melainabacteria bacterium]|nr:MAG: NAD-dependent dehydratase [Candidatus Melainabacteria bacterium]